MASEKFMQLLENINQATSDGRVRWNATDTEEDFVVNLGSVLVEVEERMQDEPPFGEVYVVTLKTNEGRNLEMAFFDEEDEPQFKVAEKLYTLARKDALKIDQIIDSVINNLKKTN